VTGWWFSTGTLVSSVTCDRLMVFYGYSGFLSELWQVGGFLRVLWFPQWIVTGWWFSTGTLVSSVTYVTGWWFSTGTLVSSVTCDRLVVFYGYSGFLSDLWQVDGFLRVLWFPPPIKHYKPKSKPIVLTLKHFIVLHDFWPVTCML
jgi:hypothetical protein